jgi:RNA polymerase sigma-70 factor (ECF subfamily)
MLRCDLDAEDVTQDVLLQVVRKRSAFRGESAFPTWLLRVTVNAALLHRRRNARLTRTVTGRLGRVRRDTMPNSCGGRWLCGPVNQLLERETAVLVERAIAGLPDGYCEALLGADVEGLPNRVVAKRLGLTLPAFKSRLHRARLMLRDALAPHCGEPYPARAGA